jgi:hypothetical protein
MPLFLVLFLLHRTDRSADSGLSQDYCPRVIFAWPTQLTSNKPSPVVEYRCTSVPLRLLQCCSTRNSENSELLAHINNT